MSPAASPTERLGSVARAATGRATRFGYATALRARAAAARGGLVPGLLSVVVPCYKVEDYLDECLVSLRFQDYRKIEIVVVDDGSPDRCAEIARAHARRDPRVRLVQRENGGLSAARNTGVEHARGEYLTFIDSDDVVQPEVFMAPMRALFESGSDFAVTCYDRLDRGRRQPAGKWIRDAHRTRRLRATIDDYPAVMVNAVAWTKVYRRSFWDEAGLEFPVGKLYEDQPVSMAAYARARAFDVVPEIGVSWRIRHERDSISQAAATSDNLAGHTGAVRTSLQALRDAGKEAAVEERALQLLANNMPFFMRHLAVADDEFWGLLREAIDELVDSISDDLYAHRVAAHNKLLYQLIIEERRDDVLAVQAGYWHDPRRFHTEVREDGVHIDLPLSEGTPPRTTLLSDVQTELVTRVLRTGFADGRLHLDGWAFIRNVDLAAHPPSLTLELRHRDGTRIPVEVELRPENRADHLGEHRYCDYRPGGFTASVPLDRVPAGSGEWTVHATMEAGGIVRSDVLDHVAPAGTAQVPHTWVRAAGDAVTAARVGRAYVVSAGPWRVWATSAEVRGGTLAVALETREDDVQGVDLVASSPRAQRVVGSLSTQRTVDGWSARGPVNAALRQLAPDETLLVQARLTVGPRPVLAPPGVDSSNAVLDAVSVVRAPRGTLQVLAPRPRVLAAEVTETSLELTVSAPPPAGRTPVLTLVNATGTAIPATVSQRDGRIRWSFPLVAPRWGREGLAVRSGKYAVGLADAHGGIMPIGPTSDLLHSLPLANLRELFGADLELTGIHVPSLALFVRPPLAEDERGRRNQQRLRDASRVEVADRDSVFFRALYGEVANCNMLGVHDELRRRGSTLELIWSIADRHVPVPEGGIGLVEGTRAWHDAIARSRYHMVNVHQLDWFEKPAGQVMIETMHGYPYKVMGHEWWSKRAFPLPQVANFDRRAREWDYFVSPATYATPLLREAFLTPAGSGAEVLEIGYPRNDVLQSPEGEEVRARTRRLLGVRDDQVVVMYAPTFRDYLSANDMTAPPVDFLDADRAAQQLGDDYVILVRGHAFNARANQLGERRGRVIDVTDHPDVNDLILASDVAVLDYSSLRFDYALTGKPMIFLVPDLERYDKGRGGVIDYVPTAPGPQVESTREVIRLLRDLPGLRRTCQPLIETFRKEYADLDDGHASARLVDAVFVPRGDAPPAG